MKRILVSALTVVLIAGTAAADITLKVGGNVDKKSFNTRTRFIEDMVKSRMDRPEPRTGEANIINGKTVIPTPAEGNAETIIYLENPKDETIVVYTHPGDNVEINLDSLEPLNYTVSGTKLVEDIASLDMAATSLLRRFESQTDGQPDENTVKEYTSEYNRIYHDYIAANRGAEGVAFAVLQLEDQDFLDNYNSLTPEEKGSLIAPLLEAQKQYVERKMAAEKKMAELQSGNFPSPDFTFDNAEGKPVSLSDFRGKWVVIDFWGTWCPWCIKGFPALKEIYAELQPRLEILGVACNDKYNAWLNGLKKYELPWVNVYNPEKGGGKILEDYAVEGFPTKVIVDPEGKIKNITVGEDPNFNDILRNLVK